LKPTCADNRRIASVRTSVAALRGLESERGQSTVEFAIILPIFILLVFGIIQFGLGLNFWLDQQRVANQGARWASVNNWPPNCPVNSTACSSTPATCSASQAGATLQETLKCQLLTNGEAAASTITICYPNGTKGAGDPVRVQISRPFKIIGIPFIAGGFGSITLRGSATARLEQSQNPADYSAPAAPLITGDVACT
jgi:Flp pilus assembly protein TadG